MKNRIKQILLIVLVFMLIISAFTSIAYCADVDPVTSLKDDMKNASDPNASEYTDNPMVKGVNIIFVLIRYVGSGVALIMIMTLGIKYMLTSVEEKAEIKKQAVPIVVGSCLLFATTQLISAVAQLAADN